MCLFKYTPSLKKLKVRIKNCFLTVSSIVLLNDGHKLLCATTTTLATEKMNIKNLMFDNESLEKYQICTKEVHILKQLLHFEEERM